MNSSTKQSKTSPALRSNGVPNPTHKTTLKNFYARSWRGIEELRSEIILQYLLADLLDHNNSMTKRLLVGITKDSKLSQQKQQRRLRLQYIRNIQWCLSMMSLFVEGFQQNVFHYRRLNVHAGMFWYWYSFWAWKSIVSWLPDALTVLSLWYWY